MSYVFVHSLHDRLGEPQYVEEQGFDRDSDKPASGGLYAVGKWEGSQTTTDRGHLSLMGSDGHSSTDASARGNPVNAKGKVEDWSVGFAMPGSSTLAVDRLAMESMGELVPGVGLEPTRLAAGDFESGAKTSAHSGVVDLQGFFLTPSMTFFAFFRGTDELYGKITEKWKLMYATQTRWR